MTSTGTGPAGKHFGAYVIQSEIATGGQGTVWRALHQLPGGAPSASARLGVAGSRLGPYTILSELLGEAWSTVRFAPGDETARVRLDRAPVDALEQAARARG